MSIKEKALQQIIAYMRNKMMAANKHNTEKVLTLAKECGITTQDLIVYCHNKAINI